MTSKKHNMLYLQWKLSSRPDRFFTTSGFGEPAILDIRQTRTILSPPKPRAQSGAGEQLISQSPEQLSERIVSRIQVFTDRLPSALHQFRDTALGKPFREDRVAESKRDMPRPEQQRVLRHDVECSVAGDRKNRKSGLNSHHESALLEGVKKAVGSSGPFRIYEDRPASA